MLLKFITFDIDFRILLLLFLSVGVSIYFYALMKKGINWYNNATKFIVNEYAEPISLLMFPSTYQEGILKLQELSPYKQYSFLLKKIVSNQRKVGGHQRSSFEDLRLAISLDIRWENRLRSFLKESCFQYTGYVVFSWALCILFFISEIKLTINYYIFILIWHIFGFVVFIFVIRKMQNKMDEIFEDFVPLLYQVIISADGQIAKDLDKLHVSKTEKTKYFKDVLSKLIRKRNAHGISITQELNLLAQDFWQFWESYWQESKTKLNRVKMTIIMLVFGAGYMLILFGISQQLIAGIFAV